MLETAILYWAIFNIFWINAVALMCSFHVVKK